MAITKELAMRATLDIAPFVGGLQDMEKAYASTNSKFEKLDKERAASREQFAKQASKAEQKARQDQTKAEQEAIKQTAKMRKSAAQEAKDAVLKATAAEREAVLKATKAVSDARRDNADDIDLIKQKEFDLAKAVSQAADAEIKATRDAYQERLKIAGDNADERLRIEAELQKKITQLEARRGSAEKRADRASTPRDVGNIGGLEVDRGLAEVGENFATLSQSIQSGDLAGAFGTLGGVKAGMIGVALDGALQLGKAFMRVGEIAREQEAAFEKLNASIRMENADITIGQLNQIEVELKAIQRPLDTTAADVAALSSKVASFAPPDAIADVTEQILNIKKVAKDTDIDNLTAGVGRLGVAFGGTAEDVKLAGDLMAQVSRDLEGVADVGAQEAMTELGNVFSKAALTIEDTNQAAKESAGLFTALTKSGFQVSEATSSAEEIFLKLNDAVNDPAIRETIMKELPEGISAFDAGIERGNVSATKFLSTLQGMGNQGQQLAAKLGGTGGEAMQMLLNQADRANVSFEEMTARFDDVEGAAVRIGSSLTPMSKKLDEIAKQRFDDLVANAGSVLTGAIDAGKQAMIGLADAASALPGPLSRVFSDSAVEAERASALYETAQSNLEAFQQFNESLSGLEGSEFIDAVNSQLETLETVAPGAAAEIQHIQNNMAEEGTAEYAEQIGEIRGILQEVEDTQAADAFIKLQESIEATAKQMQDLSAEADGMFDSFGGFVAGMSELYGVPAEVANQYRRSFAQVQKDAKANLAELREERDALKEEGVSLGGDTEEAERLREITMDIAEAQLEVSEARSASRTAMEEGLGAAQRLASTTEHIEDEEERRFTILKGLQPIIQSQPEMAAKFIQNMDKIVAGEELRIDHNGEIVEGIAEQNQAVEQQNTLQDQLNAGYQKQNSLMDQLGVTTQTQMERDRTRLQALKANAQAQIQELKAQLAIMDALEAGTIDRAKAEAEVAKIQENQAALLEEQQRIQSGGQATGVQALTAEDITAPGGNEEARAAIEQQIRDLEDFGAAINDQIDSIDDDIDAAKKARNATEDATKATKKAESADDEAAKSAMRKARADDAGAKAAKEREEADRRAARAEAARERQREEDAREREAARAWNREQRERRDREQRERRQNAQQEREEMRKAVTSALDEAFSGLFEAQTEEQQATTTLRDIAGFDIMNLGAGGRDEGVLRDLLRDLDNMEGLSASDPEKQVLAIEAAFATLAKQQIQAQAAQEQLNQEMGEIESGAVEATAEKTAELRRRQDEVNAALERIQSNKEAIENIGVEFGDATEQVESLKMSLNATHDGLKAMSQAFVRAEHNAQTIRFREAVASPEDVQTLRDIAAAVDELQPDTPNQRYAIEGFADLDFDRMVESLESGNLQIRHIRGAFRALGREFPEIGERVERDLIAPIREATREAILGPKELTPELFDNLQVLAGRADNAAEALNDASVSGESLRSILESVGRGGEITAEQFEALGGAADVIKENLNEALEDSNNLTPEAAEQLGVLADQFDQLKQAGSEVNPELARFKAIIAETDGDIEALRERVQEYYEDQSEAADIERERASASDLVQSRLEALRGEQENLDTSTHAGMLRFAELSDQIRQLEQDGRAAEEMFRDMGDAAEMEGIERAIDSIRSAGGSGAMSDAADNLQNLVDAFSETEGTDAEKMAGRFVAVAKIVQDLPDQIQQGISEVREFVDSIQEGDAGAATQQAGDITMQVGQALLSTGAGPLAVAGAVILGVGIITKAVGKIISIFKRRELTAEEQAQRERDLRDSIVESYERQNEAMERAIERGDRQLDQAREQLETQRRIANEMLRQLGYEEGIADLDAEGLEAEQRRLQEEQERLDTLIRDAEFAREGNRTQRREFLESMGIDVNAFTDTGDMIDDIISQANIDLENMSQREQEIADILGIQVDLRQLEQQAMEEQIAAQELLIKLGGDQLEALEKIRDLTRGELNDAFREAFDPENITEGEMDILRAFGLIDSAGNFVGIQGLSEDEVQALFRQLLINAPEGEIEGLVDIANTWMDAADSVEQYGSAEEDLFERRRRILELQRDLGEITQPEFFEKTLDLLNDRLEVLKEEEQQLKDQGAPQGEILDATIARMEMELEIKNLIEEQNGALMDADPILTRLVRRRQELLQLQRASGDAPTADERARIESVTAQAVARLKEIGASEEEIERFLSALPKFETGGRVRETGPAIVHAGEVVLPKSVVDAINKPFTPVAPNQTQDFFQSREARIIQAGINARQSAGGGGVSVSIGDIVVNVSGAAGDPNQIGSNVANAIFEHVQRGIDQGKIRVQR